MSQGPKTSPSDEELDLEEPPLLDDIDAIDVGDVKEVDNEGVSRILEEWITADASAELAQHFKATIEHADSSLFEANWLYFASSLLKRAGAQDNVAITIGGVGTIFRAYAGDTTMADTHRFAAARKVLKAEQDDFAKDQHAAIEVSKEIADLLSAVRDGYEARKDDWRPADGIEMKTALLIQEWVISEATGLVTVLAARIERTGPVGQVTASRLLAKAKERGNRYRDREIDLAGLLELWIPPHPYLPTDNDPAVPPFVELAIKCIWRDIVLPRLQERRRKPTALVMAVHEPVVDLFSKSMRREIERDGQRSLALPGDVLVRVRCDTAAVESSFIDRGIKLFGTVNAHRVLRWQVDIGHRQKIEKVPDFRVVHVDGGYDTLAEMLGIGGRKGAQQVRDIIEAEHSVDIPIPPDNRYTRLLIRDYRAAQGRRKAHLELVLGTAILPDYAFELKKLGVSGRPVYLVPLLPLPPMIGRNNEHGAQATLSMLVVQFMRDCARELAEQGNVSIDSEHWAQLASRAGLRPETFDVAKLIDRWTHDGPDGPALLEQPEPGRFTLAKAHTGALEFIVNGGEKSIGESERGRTAVRRREGRASQARARAPKIQSRTPPNR
jgi:hypothetical protein